MTAPHSGRDTASWWGLGWELDAPFASNRDELPRVGSYGHGGYTGTSIWIDPISKTYVIILSHRVHPRGGGDAKPLRAHIREFISGLLDPLSIDHVLDRLYLREFQIEKTLGLIGARWVLQAIKDGWDARTIAQRWEASLKEFRKLRAKYLLYPSPAVD